LDASGREAKIYRCGGLEVERIEEVLGKVKICTISERPLSPGQFKRHYAPRTPLKIIKDKDFKPKKGERAGLLAFSKGREGFEKVEVLSKRGDLREAAANFFTFLHRLDEAGLQVIYAEAVEEVGLGKAIMERLRKAEGVG
jgi:L-threonylcarbamoyladenylate synthase